VKASSLLTETLNNMEQVSKEKKSTVLPQIYGAMEHGFNEEALIQDFSDRVEELGHFKVELDKIFDLINIKDDIFKKSILDAAVLSIIHDEINLF
jgi:hypothetical protein